MDASTPAEQVWTEARRLNDLGDFRAAARALDDARAILSAAPPTDAHAARFLVRLDITGALPLFALEGYAAAAELLRAARTRARELQAPDLIALTHIQQGVIDAGSGDWAAARDQLLAAVELRSHLGPVEECSTLITLGLADLSLRKLADAADHLEQARAIAADHDLDAHLFKAIHNLGCVHFVAGDVPRALTLMGEADAMSVQVARDRAHLDYAEALMDAGLIDEASTLLEAALQDARAADHRLEEGDILLELARCGLLRGDNESARKDARRAIAAFRSRQAHSRRALGELFLAGLDLEDGAPVERALSAAALWDSAEPSTAEQVEAVLLHAEAEVARDRPEAAERALQRLGPAATLRLPVQLHVHYLRAVVADRSGRDADFVEAARTASDTLAAAQSSLRSLELRAAVARHAARLAQLDLARAVRSESAQSCIDTIERWRAASARARELTVSSDPETSALLQELRWLGSPMSPAALSDLSTREARIADLQQEIAARARRVDQSEEGPDWSTAMTHEQLLASLPAGTAYLTFAETLGQVYAVVIDPDGAPLLYSIGGRGAVEERVAAARRDLRGLAFARAVPALHRTLRRALEQSSARLGDLLFGPVADALRSAERLVIAPNDTLHAVAWSALPVVEQRPVTVTPSAARWARHGSSGPLEVHRVSAHVGPGLPESEAEVAAIRDIWAAVAASTEASKASKASRTVHLHGSGTPSGAGSGPEGAGATSPQATSADVARALAGDDVVHIAAHGHHSGDNPLFSSLRLQDGPLFAHDLVHEVQARHVVLSACDVGQARVGVGGEALGMTAALLALGVHSVVAAVAPIADEASAQASTRYHQHLAGGLDASSALARAVAETPGAEPLVYFGSDVRMRLPST